MQYHEYISCLYNGTLYVHLIMNPWLSILIKKRWKILSLEYVIIILYFDFSEEEDGEGEEEEDEEDA